MSQNRISTDAEPVCLDCGKTLDAHTSLSGKPTKPRPGDLTFCGYCGLVLSFAEDNVLRYGTQAEYEILKERVQPILSDFLDHQNIILHPGRWAWQDKSSTN